MKFGFIAKFTIAAAIALYLGYLCGPKAIQALETSISGAIGAIVGGVLSALAFVLTIGLSNWQMILALALGGLPAAPIGAWACKHLPVKRLMVIVGLLVIALSLRTLLKTFGAT